MFFNPNFFGTLDTNSNSTSTSEDDDDDDIDVFGTVLNFTFDIFFDGGARGNGTGAGSSGAGAVTFMTSPFHQRHQICSISQSLGIAEGKVTNNFAEATSSDLALTAFETFLTSDKLISPTYVSRAMITLLTKTFMVPLLNSSYVACLRL